MDDALEAGAERLRHHLRRPHHTQQNQLNINDAPAQLHRKSDSPDPGLAWGRTGSLSIATLIATTLGPKGSPVGVWCEADVVGEVASQVSAAA